MRTMIRTVAIIAAVLLCFGIAADWALESRWRQEVIKRGEGDLLNVLPEHLEHKIHVVAPLGSTRASVEQALRQEGLRFNYDLPSRTIYTGARSLKGSNWLVQAGLSIQMRFDSTDHLIQIQSQTWNTGP